MTCTVPVSSETTTEGIFQDFNGIYQSFYLLPLSSFLIHFLHHIHPFIKCQNLYPNAKYSKSIYYQRLKRCPGKIFYLTDCRMGFKDDEQS